MPHLSLQKRVLKLCYCRGQPALACRHGLHAEAVHRDGRTREKLQVARDGPVAQQQQAPQRVLPGEGRRRQQRIHLAALPHDVDEAAPTHHQRALRQRLRVLVSCSPGQLASGMPGWQLLVVHFGGALSWDALGGR